VFIARQSRRANDRYQAPHESPGGDSTSRMKAWSVTRCSTAGRLVRSGVEREAKVVNGDLQCNMYPDSWTDFLQEGLVHFNGSEDDVMESLRLSTSAYQHRSRFAFDIAAYFRRTMNLKRKI